MIRRKLWLLAFLLITPAVASAQVITSGPQVQIVSGGITTADNSANPAAKLPVLAGRANAAAPSWTEGNIVPLSVDLSGLLRTSAAAAAASDTVGTSTSLAALNNAASVALAGQQGADVIFTAAASPVMTLTPEVSPDGGTTWFTAVFFDPLSGVTSTSLVNPANGQWMIGYVGAESNARVRVSAFTSGSITAQLRATVTRPYIVNYLSDGTNLQVMRIGQATMAGSVPVVIASNQTAVSENVSQWNGTTVLTGGVAGSVGVGGLAASGAALSGNPALVGGSDGTNAQNLRVQANNTAAANGVLALPGRFDTTLPTLTSGNVAALELDASGRLLVASIAGALPTGTNSLGTVGLNAGTAVIGKTIQATACGTTVANQALAAVPTAEAALFTATTCLEEVVVCNTNATAQTFSLKDNQATPIIAINGVSIPGLSCYVYPWNGSQFTTGVRWVAGGTGMTATLWGYQ